MNKYMLSMCVMYIYYSIDVVLVTDVGRGSSGEEPSSSRSGSGTYLGILSSTLALLVMAVLITSSMSVGLLDVALAVQLEEWVRICLCMYGVILILNTNIFGKLIFDTLSHQYFQIDYL